MASYALYSEPPQLQRLGEHDSDTQLDDDSNHDYRNGEQLHNKVQEKQEEQREAKQDKQDKEDKEDGGEEGGESKKPPTPVGFWDPRLSHVRKEAMSKWLLTTVVLMCFILGVLSICESVRASPTLIS